VMPCEMCLRILYYNPPVALDNEMSAKYAGGTRAHN